MSKTGSGAGGHPRAPFKTYSGHLVSQGEGYWPPVLVYIVNSIYEKFKYYCQACDRHIRTFSYNDTTSVPGSNLYHIQASVDYYSPPCPMKTVVA